MRIVRSFRAMLLSCSPDCRHSLPLCKRKFDTFAASHHTNELHYAILFSLPPFVFVRVCCESAIGVCVSVSVEIFLFECIIKPNRNFTDRDSLRKHLGFFLLLLFAFRCSLLSLPLLLLLSSSSSPLTLHIGFELFYVCIPLSFREFDEIIV